jgi:hypothetical protein
MGKFINFIKLSTKESSTRIMAYLFTAVIILFSMTFLGIEISTAVIALTHTKTYIISNEIIIIFAALMTHVLTLLGINKYSAVKMFNNDTSKTGETPDLGDGKINEEETKESV